jgi:hypothetical protein
MASGSADLSVRRANIPQPGGNHANEEQPRATDNAERTMGAKKFMGEN